MDNIFDAFPSKYLKASDLGGQHRRVIMDRIETEDVGDGRKPVVYFRGKDKGLVLNRTNANAIAEMYGQSPRQWIGKEIVLYPTRVDYRGERKDAIRIQFVQPQQQSRPAPTPAQQQTQPQQYDERNPPPRTTADEMNDDIPW